MIFGDLIYLLIAAIILVIFFFWLRRKMIQNKKEKLEELKEDFKGGTPRRRAKTEDEKLLDEISEKIEKSIEEGKKTVEISLDEGYDIKIETPDVFSLQTPKTALYKSFEKIKFKEVEESEKGVKLHLQ